MHLVVFDIDGTLTNTDQVDGECYWRAVCEVFGFSGEQPEWTDFRHVTDLGIASELCERHLGRQLVSADADALSRRLTTLLDFALAGKEPTAYQIPGSEDVLSILNSSCEFAVALATGGFRLAAELKLRRAGLFNPSISLASSDDAASRGSIMRVAARRAAEKYATQFDKFTYVGDGVWDVKAARALGWKFMGIGSGVQADRLRQAGAALTIPNYCPASVFLDLLAG
jgi:phosphoglycolate phosphatase-like HAD superfamily hydrolase